MADYESLIKERLQLRLKAEIASGYTLVGPHRDELEILFDGRDIRTYGSSGQQRSALILLDLAAISVYHLWHNEYPLFLMDDVDAELDKRRIGYLLEYLEGRTQTFITTSKNDLIKGFAENAKLFDVRNGAAFNSTGVELERTIATSTESI
jgi:DNA replication and repair protein RecF